MSHQTYNELWKEAQAILEDTTYKDNIQISSKPSKDTKHLHKQISIIYAKYIVAINKLAECYDQMVHPQKRQLIRKILDASIIRFLELKHELVNLVLSEYTYLDDGMEELKLLPQDVEIQIPECYKRERQTNIEWKQKFIDDTLSKMGVREEEVLGIQMTEEDAILLIQRHERARQYRMRAKFMKNIREIKERTKNEDEKFTDTNRKSALKIQRAWRGFITRRKIKKHIIEEMLLIGMLEPDCYPTVERCKANKLKLTKYEVQEKFQLEYLAALEKEKEDIKKHRGNIIMEEIRDEIRNWYMLYKQQTGRFPVIPSEEHGGSKMIMKCQSPLAAGSSDGSHSTFATSFDSKSSRSKKSTISSQEEKRKSSEDDYTGFKISPSNILAELEAENAEYEEVWKYRDESDNPQQTFILDMIRTQKTAEVEVELRKIVDIQLQAELENLQAALERDEKGKRVKKGSKKKARRSGKKSKKKKDKDLTSERTLESLFEELILNGIIRKYPQTPISSFLGDISYVGYKYECEKKNLMPSLGDIRQVIKEYCILPMSSVNIHQTAPLLKSILITAPKDSGKDMLVHAICTEIGAILFDLSAVNIVGKYPGKSGLMMLIHLINKVSKLLQPSIIYIDDAEKTLMKKVPKTDRTDPKRLKKDLIKIVKSIGPSDLVMLIGVSHAPWDCDQKLLTQTYNKILMMLRPDYASLNLLWSDILIRCNAFNREINLCILTKLCDGYPVGILMKAMQMLMTCKRMLRLKIYPLQLTEILEALSKFEPIYKEEEDAFIQWYTKTPLGRCRQKALEIDSHEQKESGNTQKKKRS